MPKVSYPDTLPDPSQYPFAPRERRAVSPQQGPTELRARALEQLVDARSVQWRYTPEQMATWREWFDGTLRGGLRWFSVSLPGVGGWQQRVARFVNAPLRAHLGAGMWEVTADLEVNGSRAEPWYGAYWNPGDTSAGFSISEDRQTATRSTSGFQTTRCSQFRSSGRWYFEIEIVSGVNSSQVHAPSLGLLSRNAAIPYPGDGDPDWENSWGQVSDGRKGQGSVLSAFGASFTNGMTWMCAADFDAGKVWFGRDGAFSGSPAAGTSPAFSNLAGPLAPEVSAETGSTVVIGRFAAEDFTYTPPAGFEPWAGE